VFVYNTEQNMEEFGEVVQDNRISFVMDSNKDQNIFLGASI
jgi:hypothetical protein